MTSGNGTTVATGPAMESEAEAEHRWQVLATYVDQADDAVEVIEAKLAGMKESLAAAKAEAKRLHAELRKMGD
jgi:hypothetical protein